MLRKFSGIVGFFCAFYHLNHFFMFVFVYFFLFIYLYLEQFVTKLHELFA